MGANNKKILCVCFGNTCRSPMMEKLLERELGGDFEVESAGISENAAVGNPANEYATLCMQERGIDLSEHRSRFVGDLNLRDYAYIVCVGEAEKGQVRLKYLPAIHPVVVLVANGDHGGVADPYRRGLSAYRECVALLDQVIPDIARQIRGS